MRTARESSVRCLATVLASGAATGAPEEAAAVAGAGAADGGISGDAAGWSVVRITGSWSLSVFLSGRGNTLHPRSCSAAQAQHLISAMFCFNLIDIHMPKATVGDAARWSVVRIVGSWSLSGFLSGRGNLYPHQQMLHWPALALYNVKASHSIQKWHFGDGAGWSIVRMV